MTIDNDGKVEYSNESDYIEKIAPDPMISNNESFATNAASNWTFVDSAYNSNPNVKQWGYLYKQKKSLLEKLIILIMIKELKFQS